MSDYDAQPGRTSAPEPDLSAAQREADDVDLYAGLSGVAGLVAAITQVNKGSGSSADTSMPTNPGGGFTPRPSFNLVPFLQYMRR